LKPSFGQLTFYALILGDIRPSVRQHLSSGSSGVIPLKSMSKNSTGGELPDIDAERFGRKEEAIAWPFVTEALVRYLQGKFSTIRPAHLTAIFEGLGGTKAENAALVQAYLLDRISEECWRWVDIRIVGAKDTGR